MAIIENYKRRGKEFVVECDVCGELPEAVFDDFWKAKKYVDDEGWLTELDNCEWINICPECIDLEGE